MIKSERKPVGGIGSPKWWMISFNRRRNPNLTAPKGFKEIAEKTDRRGTIYRLESNQHFLYEEQMLYR